MRPFLSDPLPSAPVPPSEARVTYQGRVLASMASGDWFTRRELEIASGLGCGAVNTVLQHGLRRGSIEREVPLLRGCTKAVTQRYRRGR